MITASMSAGDAGPQLRTQRQADWELDFYSRPILEKDGKKRWELLIISTPEINADGCFRFAKICPASKVNSNAGFIKIRGDFEFLGNACLDLVCQSLRIDPFRVSDHPGPVGRIDSL